MQQQQQQHHHHQHRPHRGHRQQQHQQQPQQQQQPVCYCRVHGYVTRIDPAVEAIRSHGHGVHRAASFSAASAASFGSAGSTHTVGSARHVRIPQMAANPDAAGQLQQWPTRPTEHFPPPVQHASLPRRMHDTYEALQQQQQMYQQQLVQQRRRQLLEQQTLSPERLLQVGGPVGGPHTIARSKVRQQRSADMDDFYRSAPASPVSAAVIAHRAAKDKFSPLVPVFTHPAATSMYGSAAALTPEPTPSEYSTVVSTGCCGRELVTFSTTSSSSKLLRTSALSRSSSELDETPPRTRALLAEERGQLTAFAANPQRAVSDCVKNLVHWVNSVGDRVGKGTTALMDALPSLKEDFHVVMIGLDSAGKTTILYRLKFDQYVNTVATVGFNCERVRGVTGRSRHLTFLMWDVGGQEKLRPLWRPYTRATDAIVFVVDSTDEDRMDEARLELHRILGTPDNAAVPLLVIANKQDLPSAKSAAEVEKALGLPDVPSRVWHLEPVCAVTGEGLDAAVERLHALILKRRKLSKRARNKTR